MLRLALSDGSSVTVAVAAGLLPEGSLKLGLRPESVQLCALGAGTTQGVIEFIEYLGDRSHVFVSLRSGERLVALSGGVCAFNVNDAVGVRLDAQAAHIFGADGRNYRTPR